ncbi:MAG: hypothetical protein M1839_005395, partial [Geoglossum umbratile]
SGNSLQRWAKLCHTERLWLERLSVTGRATTCRRGSLRDKSKRGLVIKDSWGYVERPEEGLFLKEATEAGIKNVARYYHHETVRTGGEVDDVLDKVLQVQEGVGAGAEVKP